MNFAVCYGATGSVRAGKKQDMIRVTGRRARAD